MEQVRTIFNDRKTEIGTYLELVESIERSIQSGTPVIQIGDTEYTILPLQQRILYAGIYLHLYNLVEATVTLLIAAVERAAIRSVTEQKSNAWQLSTLMRQQWIRSVAATHDKFLNEESRLARAITLCEQLVGLIPFDLKIFTGAGGNWDDDEIETLVARLGVNLTIPTQVYSDVKRPTRDNKGPLKLIKDLRNKLAHGAISFSECGNDHVANDLRETTRITIDYLESVIDAFNQYIASLEYLQPPREPDDVLSGVESSAQ